VAPVTEAEAPPSGGGGGTGSMLVVGDSLAVGAAPHLESALGGWRVEQVTRTGMPTAEGVAEVTGRGGSLPGTVAISLGTNDDPSAVETFRGQVQAVLDAAGPGRCVVWANIVRPPYNGVSYSGYNRALAGVAAANPNLRIVDWAGIAGANPSLLAEDGVHATTAGYAARGRAYAQEVSACGG
jgi:lysophospholipase L1-like esterase